jgi:hypothetical protein
MENYGARILRGGLSFGEGPRWRDGRPWYSDFYRFAIYSTDAQGSPPPARLKPLKSRCPARDCPRR